jgi:hypothetical protein
MLRLTGRLADGWAAPIVSYLPYQRWAEAQSIVDRAAVAAGRDPRQVRRIANLVGSITAGGGTPPLEGSDPIRTDVVGWRALLRRLALEVGFDTFILWPEDATADQLEAFGGEVAPALRQLSL